MLTGRSTLGWIVVGIAACALVGVGLIAWLGIPASSRSDNISARDYLRSDTGAPVVRMDDHVNDVAAALRRGPGACEQVIERIGAQIGADTDLPERIQAIPDTQLGELLVDEDSLMHTALASCARGDTAIDSYVTQLDIFHQAIRSRLAALGITR